MKEKLHYLKYSIFHPFDGFYEIKFRNKGSALLAAIILIIYGILQCASYQYNGFVMNQNPLHEMNSITIFISSLSILILFTVSNWTITTLFNGKGNMKDIFIVLCYSMVPVIIAQAIVIFVSNFVIEEEIMILQSLQSFAWVWFVFLLIAGLCVTHEYSFSVNIVTLLATFAAAIIIIFLLILFFTLMERMAAFFISVVQEFMRRL
jgi:Yip1 domain.